MRTLIRSSLLVLAATVGLIAAQEPSETQHQDPKELLGELIEKAKELESFHAVYKISSPTKGDGELRVHYAKPDRLTFRGIVGDSRYECVIRGASMNLLMQSGEQDGVFAAVNCIPVPAACVDKAFESVRERFPGASIADPAEVLGPSILFHATSTPEDEPQLSYEVSNRLGREGILGWLPYLQRQGRVVQETADTITFEGAVESTLVLNKKTGFLESARVPWEQGDKTLELLTLELDEPIEASEFEPAEPGAGQSDQSAALEAQLFWSEVLWMRATAAGAIAKLVEQDTVAWDDAARSKARESFVGLHAAIVELQLSDWVERMDSRIGEFAAWFQSSRAHAGGDPERLAVLDQEVAKNERGIRDSIEKSREGYRTRASMPWPTKDEIPWNELVQIDADALEEAFTQQVERPLIDQFEKQIALAREGKLPDPSGGKIERPASR